MSEVSSRPRAKMPAQKKWLSKQDYATPKEFLEAVKKKFGVEEWAWDLAATSENSVVTEARYFGPDHKLAWRDSLAQDWARMKGDLWLNPPYADIAPWAAKCAASAQPLADGGVRLDGKRLTRAPYRRIFFLVPAAVGSNWFADHIDGKALVVFPRPRLSFDGKSPYPKDILLVAYGERPSYQTWRWRP